MKCLECGKQTKVIDSRGNDKGLSVRRRRECLNRACRSRATSYEIYDGSGTVEITEITRITNFLQRIRATADELESFIQQLHAQNQ